MAAPSKLEIKILADGQSAKVEFDRVSTAAGKFGEKVENIDRSTAALTSSFSRMGHAAAAAFGGRELIQAADAYSALNAQLKIATGSLLAGEAAYRDTLNIALKTGQALSDVGTVYKRFADNATALGLSQAQVASTTEAVSQAIALSGGSAASAQAALTQFGQALASGALRGEELNSVMESAPRLAKAIADGMNIPIGKLREMAAAGQVTSDEIIKAMANQSKRLADEFGTLPVTMGRALTNVQTAFTNTVGSFEKGTGAFSAAASGVNALAENMDALAGAVGVVASVMAGRAVSGLAAATAAKVANMTAARALIAVELQAAQAAAASASAALVAASAYGVNTAAANTAATANARLAAAQTAVKAAGMGAMALGALGGPIGIVTTALTLGVTAWQLWGDKAEEKTATVARSAVESLDAAIRKIEEMNGRLDQVSRKSYDATIASTESQLKTTRAEIGYLQTELDKLDQAGGRGRFSDQGRTLQASLNAQVEREIVLQGELTAARSKSAQVGTAALNAFVNANAVGDEKVRVKQEKLLSEFSQAIANTGGVLDLSNTAHKAAFDALNAGLADAAKGAEKTSQAYNPLIERSAELARLNKEADKELEASTKQREEYAKAIAAALDPLDKQAAQLELEVEYYGKTEAEIQRTIVARLEEARAIAALNGADEDHLYFLQREIDARKRIAEASASKDALEAGKRAAEAQAQEWKRVSDDIERALTDSLFRAFESGKGAGDTFVQSLKNTLNATVLKVAVQAVVSPVTGAVGQALGLQQAGSALSGGNLLMSAGGALGSSSLNLIGTGASIGWSAAGEAAAAYSAAGMTGEALALQAGAAMPYIAAAMAAYSLFSKDGGGPKTEMYGGSRDVAWGLAQTAPVTAAVDAIAAGVSQQFDAILSGFGKSAALSLGLGGDADPQGTAGSRVGYSLTADGQSRFSEISVASLDDAALAATASRALLAALEAVDINGVVNQYLDGLNIAGLTAEQAAAAVATVQAFDSVADALEAMGAGASALSADMVAAAGGITALQAQLAGYYDKFYSDEEKAADARAALLEQFKSLGLAMPETRDGFRALVDSLDLSTASGQKTYAQLIALSGAFATVADAAAAASSAALTAAQSATDAAMTALRNAVATQRTSAQAALDAANEQRTAVKSVFDTLKASIADLTGAATGTTASAGAAFIDQALATARASGYLPDADALSAAVTAVRSSLTADQFASGADLARAQLQLAGKLTALQSLAAPKLTAADSAAALAQSQMAALDAQLASAQAQVDAARGVGSAKTVQEALADLQTALTGESSLLARIRDNTLLTVAAIDALAKTNSAAAIEQLYQSILGRASDAAGSAYWQQQYASGSSVQSIVDAFFASPEYKSLAASGAAPATSLTPSATAPAASASALVTPATSPGDVVFNSALTLDQKASILGVTVADVLGYANSVLGAGTYSYDTGTPFVPFDMQANIHRGEIIIDPQSSSILRRYGIGVSAPAGSAQDNAALLAEIKALREEVVNLRAETRSTATSSAKTARILDAVTTGGESIKTEAFAL